MCGWTASQEGQALVWQHCIRHRVLAFGGAGMALTCCQGFTMAVAGVRGSLRADWDISAEALSCLTSVFPSDGSAWHAGIITVPSPVAFHSAGMFAPRGQIQQRLRPLWVPAWTTDGVLSMAVHTRHTELAAGPGAASASQRRESTAGCFPEERRVSVPGGCSGTEPVRGAARQQTQWTLLLHPTGKHPAVPSLFQSSSP